MNMSLEGLLNEIENLAGVSCKTVTGTVPLRPANITAYHLGDPLPSSGTIPFQVRITCRWQNTGEESGTFRPKLQIGNTSIESTSGIDETIPAMSIGQQWNFVFTVRTQGTTEVCPIPN